MAFQCKPKFLTQSQDTYRDPYRDQSDFKYYSPQSNFPSTDEYRPNKGTKMWFQDYRRSNIEENVLRKNLSSLQSPIRPSTFSDKPDIALGARKQERESLLPSIQNKSVYTLTNRNPDQIRDRDLAFMHKVQQHRKQMKDLTGSLHKTEDHFYFPFPAKDTFCERNVSSNHITDFPSHSIAANEFIVDKKREPSLINFHEISVCK